MFYQSASCNSQSVKNEFYSETRASELIYTLDQGRRQSQTYLITPDLAHGPDHTA